MVYYCVFMEVYIFMHFFFFRVFSCPLYRPTYVNPTPYVIPHQSGVFKEKDEEKEAQMNDK